MILTIPCHPAYTAIIATGTNDIVPIIHVAPQLD